MFVEKKKINGKDYYYLKQSFREGKKVKSKTLTYLGKAPLTKQELNKKINEYNKKMQKQDEFLTLKQINKLNEIKKSFKNKLKLTDKKLIADMFKDFKTYYIYNTNAIEGNTLTLEETDNLLNNQKTPEEKDLREVYDHINERDVFDELLQNKPKIELNTIIDIHQRLLRNIDKRTGDFRRHNVRVFGATFETSDAKYVLTDMKILLKWYKNNKNLHPLILAATFHEKFERIHPFYDGNGRTGRMLLNLILLRANLPPLIIKNKTRKEYYKVLDQGHKVPLNQIDNNYDPIIQFCYSNLIETYKNIFSRWG